ncbi:MFS transporter [Arenibacter algicola]|uniref:L-fucose-proton symporter n=1 Tax=Arenibacter algicola TaxID=616991 RepID=A0A221UQW8_9FLAO|nr:MFS transporter [Arenibacter algicola]ASO03653.1 L-fucose-proton symporter [Arenibacter algicola]|tara:strand:- start:255 stop:1535 length:1281 start_codon:yes stop_codon:yes gene_type:complete
MGKNRFIVALILFIFFVISFLTNILGPLIPDIISDFKVSLTMAALLPFAFFVAYGVFSIPSGVAVERYGEKQVILSAFLISFIGAILFSIFPNFPIALISLFLIGSGMAMLQVAINPLLRVAGGEEHFAFNSVMGQLAFGMASFMSPFLFTYLVLNLEDYPGPDNSNFIINIFHNIVPENLPWVSLYWIFAMISLIMVIFIYPITLPKVERNEEEKAGSWATNKDLLKNKKVILFFMGLFAYVGTEQGVANWMSQFLSEYHGLDPRIEGANAISLFWGLLTVGCILGLLLLKFMDSKLVLKIFSGAAILGLTAALFGPAHIAVLAFPLVGFFASVMWSVIFSLALNSVKKNHGALSGILCSGIVGGAIVPLIVGALGDLVGLKGGMFFLYITLGFIFSIGFWASPLVNNKTIKLKEFFGNNKKSEP